MAKERAKYRSLRLQGFNCGMDDFRGSVVNQRVVEVLEVLYNCYKLWLAWCNSPSEGGLMLGGRTSLVLIITQPSALHALVVLL
jgi:hypothetical protein